MRGVRACVVALAATVWLGLGGCPAVAGEDPWPFSGTAAPWDGPA